MATFTRTLVVGAVLLAGVVVGVTVLAARGGPDPGPLAPIVVVDTDGSPGIPASGTPTSSPTSSPTTAPSSGPSSGPTRSATPAARPSRDVPVVPPKPTRVADDDDDDRGDDDSDDTDETDGGDDDD